MQGYSQKGSETLSMATSGTSGQGVQNAVSGILEEVAVDGPLHRFIQKSGASHVN